jgi:osmotically-inducible protein OsmY
MAGTAAGMYYFDPQLGRRRRVQLRDQALALVRREAREATAKARYAEGKLEGVLAEAQGRGRPHPADDRVVMELVRAELHRLPFPTHEVVIEVVDGVCRLRGQLVSHSQMDAAVEAAGRTPGVNQVQSFLHLPGEPPPNKEPVLDLTAGMGTGTAIKQ